ncbi:globin domain-containing protein [Actinomycetes bacterium KLBMP 9759]
MTNPQFVEPMPSVDEVQRPSPATIAAVRDSCMAVAARPAVLAEVFYAHLFEMAPQLRAMFPEDMSGQMQKMSDTLLAGIAALQEPDTARVEATLRRLGASHRRHYRVEPEHYGYVGHALTRAVRDVAGSRYSGSLSSAWIAVVQWIAAHMMAGAAAVEAGLSPTGRPLGVPHQREGVNTPPHGANVHHDGSTVPQQRESGGTVARRRVGGPTRY